MADLIVSQLAAQRTAPPPPPQKPGQMPVRPVCCRCGASIEGADATTPIRLIYGLLRPRRPAGRALRNRTTSPARRDRRRAGRSRRLSIAPNLNELSQVSQRSRSIVPRLSASRQSLLARRCKSRNLSPPAPGIAMARRLPPRRGSRPAAAPLHAGGKSRRTMETSLRVSRLSARTQILRNCTRTWSRSDRGMWWRAWIFRPS